jgi:cytosine deaminase
MNEHAHLDKGMLIPTAVYKDESAPVRAGWTREAKAAFTKADIIERAEKALKTMIHYGTAYVRTHVDVDPLVGTRGIEAILELKKKYESQIVIDITAFSQEGFDRFPESADLLKEALSMGVMGIGGHTLADSNGMDHIRRIFTLAEKYNAGWVEFHTDESGKPEHFLLPFLAEETARRGWGGKTYAIHCNSLAAVEEREAANAIELTAKAGLHVTVCPTAIATRAVTLVKRLRNSGIRIGLGSDNIGDYFNPLGSGNMLQYAQLLAYLQRFYEPAEMDYLIGIIQRVPEIKESEAAIMSLPEAYRYDSRSARELLTHAPTPFRLETNG